MIERAFRLDFFIAIAALVVSILTTMTLIYQTHVIEEQYSSTIWPYLSLDTTTSPDGVKIALTNDGLGPALVRSAQLTVDGKAISGWNVFLRSIIPQVVRITHRRGSFASATTDTDAATILRPGASLMLLRIFGLPKNVPVKVITAHTVTLDVCYCSLNGRCWREHSVAGVSSLAGPQPVSACATGARIGA